MVSYAIFILVVAGVYALLALSVTLSWGMAGMANLGLLGFFAIGSYTFAILSTTFGLPPALGVVASVAIGWLAGLVVTLSTLRLRDDYLAIVTLALAEVIRQVASNEIWLTGGTNGISGIPGILPRAWGNLFHQGMFLFVSAAIFVVLLVLTRLARSPWGRALRGVREDAVVASVAGKDVTRLKWQAFSMSTAIAAFAGASYAAYISYVTPELFQPLITTYVFLAVIVGGAGRPVGAVVGAYGLLIALEATRFAAELIPALTAQQAAAIRELLVGVSLITLLRLAPEGLLPEKRGSLENVRPVKNRA